MAESSWDAGTFEGSRRAQLRSAVRLTVRERLETLGDLAGTSNELAVAGRQARVSVADSHKLSLDGCRAVPLAAYLKALGVLRLVAEQADHRARGWWEGDRFRLASALDGDGLTEFFLNGYRPTPIIAPWNGGSGFHPGDNTSGLGPIEGGEAGRFAPFREAIATARRVLDRLGLEGKPRPADKERVLLLLRGELPESALAWMDAAVLLTEESPRYPPLLGTGGNDGRLDFTNNFMQRLVDLLDPGSGSAAAAARELLRHAIFDEPVPHLVDKAIGQFAPGLAGGPNAASTWEGSGSVNPWDFVLMLEGAVLFAAAATRRLESDVAGRPSYPFTVAPRGAGSGAADLSDERTSRGELWMPLWARPTSLVELQALLGEGRATVGRRNARDGVDYARAVARLGVARGLDSFQRYGFLRRQGLAYLATPLNRVPVRANPTAEIIEQLEHGDWLNRFRRLARRKESPARLATLSRRLDDALFDVALHGNSSPAPAQAALGALGEILLYFARSPSARSLCRPIPPLGSSWAAAADDGSDEFRLARAWAGIDVRRVTGVPTRPMPMILHIAPVHERNRRAWSEADHHDVVWGGGPLDANLAQVVERRLLAANRLGLSEVPFSGRVSAPLSTVSAWLAGRIDHDRTRRLVVGLALVHHAAPGGPRPRPRIQQVPPLAYRLLKPFFCPASQLRRVQLLDAERDPPLPLDIVRSLRGGDVGRACDRARARLRALGRPVPHHIGSENGDGVRLLAALLAPVSDRSLAILLEPFGQSKGTPSNPDLTSSE